MIDLCNSCKCTAPPSPPILGGSDHWSYFVMYQHRSHADMCLNKTKQQKKWIIHVSFHSTNLHKFFPEFIFYLGKLRNGEKMIEIMKKKNDTDKFEVCIDILVTSVQICFLRVMRNNKRLICLLRNSYYLDIIDNFSPRRLKT